MIPFDSPVSGTLDLTDKTRINPWIFEKRATNKYCFTKTSKTKDFKKRLLDIHAISDILDYTLTIIFVQ